MFQQIETGDGVRVVLKFWQNFRLAVLIKVVLAYQKANPNSHSVRGVVQEINILRRSIIIFKIKNLRGVIILKVKISDFLK